MKAIATITHQYGSNATGWIPGEPYELSASVGDRRITITLESGSRWVKRYYLRDPFKGEFVYKHALMSGERVKFKLRKCDDEK